MGARAVLEDRVVDVSLDNLHEIINDQGLGRISRDMVSGDTVRLTFKSSGGTHDLIIDELVVATNQIGDEEEEEVEFVADKAGTFEYYCSVANHRAMGMIGKLIVE